MLAGFALSFKNAKGSRIIGIVNSKMMKFSIGSYDCNIRFGKGSSRGFQLKNILYTFRLLSQHV